MAYRVRTRNCYDPTSPEPYKLSRSRLEVYLSCPRCFYLDRRLGIDRIRGPAFTLNCATDTLLKKEFDAHRAAATPHPLFERFGIAAIPYAHPDLHTWRENFQGMQFHHAATNLVLTGAIDDVWQLQDGSLAIVDYKSTSTAKAISLDDPWKQAYKRQMEIYQWLFRKHGFPISNTGYFLFVNADTACEAFGDTLKFTSQIIPYTGDDAWVEAAVIAAHACLRTETLPAASPDCDWCGYRHASSATSILERLRPCPPAGQEHRS